MSLNVPADKNLGTDGISVLMIPDDSRLLLGGHMISIEDFCLITEYVLTNKNLHKGDPRLQLIECIKSMEKKQGWGNQGQRLVPSTPLEYPQSSSSS